ncbi:hypothetical protein SBOR_4827 [Sclerotinia borealis F-4128]|uniref:Uncharacterized protein n=1 Tax=Sclerotinia borealis (strain F-4128) TaxID=1432307 RepID=W9CFZ5_SCLBF|nr:hypothetical protein SBOR_4827 [Sclerotinia borealis F-4128]
MLSPSPSPLPGQQPQNQNPRRKRKKTHPIKPRHRLIRTPNLHKAGRGHHAITLTIRTLFRIGIGIGPGILASKHILFLLAHKGFAVVDAAREYVLVGTGEAFEPVGAREITDGAGGVGRGGVGGVGGGGGG